MVTFRPDGNVLASGGGNFDKTIKLWDTFSGALLMTLNGHNGSIFALAFSPDGNLLASAGGHVDFSVRLWNARSGTAIGKLGVHDNWVHSLAWSPDYKLLASGCNDQTMRLWSFSTT
jgi:WD40 repeat protein